MDQGQRGEFTFDRRETTEEHERSSGARIQVAGVGGGGTNAVNRMIDANVQGIEFLALNTDAQALDAARASTRLRLGPSTTRGLGAGGNPAIGAKAAEESQDAIRGALSGADMVFITAGMGGGTGTGASPIVARTARELGALTVGVVTTPFAFERRRRMLAQQGIAALREAVDALIIVPNERLMQLASRDTSAFEAYRFADDVLRLGIQGISDLITVPGLINLDFADIRAVMADAGSAFLSMSEARGENRTESLIRDALTNPLLDADIKGARGLIFNIAGGDDLTMHEIGLIADRITGAAHPDANVIFGTVYDPSLDGALKLTIVATGFEPRVMHSPEHTAAAAVAHVASPVQHAPAAVRVSGSEQYAYAAQPAQVYPAQPSASVYAAPHPAQATVAQPVVPTPMTPVLLESHRPEWEHAAGRQGASEPAPAYASRSEAGEYPVAHPAVTALRQTVGTVLSDEYAERHVAHGRPPYPHGVQHYAERGPLPQLEGHPQIPGAMGHYVDEEYAGDYEDEEIDDHDDVTCGGLLGRFFRR